MAKLLTSMDDLPASLRGCALAIGNFDGVHRGHASLVRELVLQARAVSGPAVVMTFDPPPTAVLFPDRELGPPLTSIARRAELLGQLGVDALISYPTDQVLLSLTAEEFFEQKIVGTLSAKAVVEGPNFRFGKDRLGDTQLLEQLGSKHGLRIKVVEARNQNDQMISSTRIREALGRGEVEAAGAMLTAPYSLDGVVIEGSQRGRELGFPTANLGELTSLTPATGVYAARVQVEDKWQPAAVNVGPNPTFGDTRNKVEIHLIDWQGDLYGQSLRCFFLRRIRGVQKFADLNALKRQLVEDVETCRTLISKQVANGI